MQKQKNDPTDPQRFAISAGYLIMAAPFMYWLGICSATLFEKPVFVRFFLLQDTPLAEAAGIMVLIALPVMALMINLKARYDRLIRDSKPTARTDRAQLLLILCALLSIVGAFEFTFFTRMDILHYVYMQP